MEKTAEKEFEMTITYVYKFSAEDKETAEELAKEIANDNVDYMKIDVKETTDNK